ncbi:MAG: hypothetical protein Kow00107_03170 [Planctomycetota bacterium]
MADLGLPRSSRLLKKAEFDRLFADGRKVVGRHIIAFIAPSQNSRLGLVVSKRWGGAVRRNRIKRLMREAFRQTKAEVDFSFDVILLPKSFGPDTRLLDVIEDLEWIVNKFLERETSSR